MSLALGEYFNQHQYGNTTLADFMTALNRHFNGPFSLDSWQKDWIETPGCNSLEPELTSDSLIIR